MPVMAPASTTNQWTGVAVPSTSWRTSSTKRPAGDHQVDAFRLAGVVVVQEQLRLMRNGLPALS
jgi:hypothetical protein